MGLDMYAHYLHDAPAKAVDFEVENYGELHYWRKHPNLHGWMERLYRKKGGREDSFNCVNVLLTADDLDRLKPTSAPAICRRLPASSSARATAQRSMMTCASSPKPVRPSPRG